MTKPSLSAAQATQKANLILDKDFVISRVDERLFGSFVEHLGRAVYGGIYDPGNPASDHNGYRRDVLELIRKLGVSVVRYPGGNFVSGFNWEDSIGPVGQRPSRLDLAWFTTETNRFGLHEFCDWAGQAGVDPMYAINLGTRGLDEARNIVEYCNHPGGSQWSDLRKKNGAADPLGIKLWCLGNEMDGPWQIGQKTAYEYGRAANEAAKVMKWVDPSIELVACGSSAYDMPTFGSWELEMLEQCYENVDYVSLHRYYANRENDLPNFLAKTVDMDGFIHTVVSICDAVGGKKHSRKKLNLSFDEWNVWYHSNEQDREIQKRSKWGEALPLLEDIYTFEDALLVGGLLNTLVRHADRVKIACLAQLVNVIAPIMTSPTGCWPQTIFWPFMHVATYGRGTALEPVVQSPVYRSTDYDAVPVLDASAVLADDGGLTIFVLNRSGQDRLALRCDLRGFGRLAFVEQVELQHADVKAVNTEERPDTVAPVIRSEYDMDEGQFVFGLAPLSWNVIRLKAG